MSAVLASAARPFPSASPVARALKELSKDPTASERFDMPVVVILPGEEGSPAYYHSTARELMGDMWAAGLGAPEWAMNLPEDDPRLAGFPVWEHFPTPEIRGSVAVYVHQDFADGNCVIQWAGGPDSYAVQRATQATEVIRADAPSVESSPISDDSAIEYFRRPSVSIKTLIQHGAASLRDLYTVGDDAIRICYLKDGEVVTEAVTRLQLLSRADAIGWRPWPAADDSDEQISFYDAVPFFDELTGHRWFAGEGAYDGDCIPVGLPAESAARARAAAEERAQTLREHEMAREEASIQTEARGVHLRSLGPEPPALTMQQAVELVRGWRAEAAAERKAQWEAKYGAAVQA